MPVILPAATLKFARLSARAKVPAAVVLPEFIDDPTTKITSALVSRLAVDGVGRQTEDALIDWPITFVTYQA